MKNYTITVNGNVYDVVVEEGVQGAAPAYAPKAAPRPAAPAPAPAPAPAAAPASAPAPAPAAAPAMKMEIPVVAPQDGTVASIDVAVGDAIEAGALLATLN